jgi:hypothetical protein
MINVIIQTCRCRYPTLAITRTGILEAAATSFTEAICTIRCIIDDDLTAIDRYWNRSTRGSPFTIFPEIGAKGIYICPCIVYKVLRLKMKMRCSGPTSIATCSKDLALIDRSIRSSKTKCYSTEMRIPTSISIPIINTGMKSKSTIVIVNWPGRTIVTVIIPPTDCIHCTTSSG